MLILSSLGLLSDDMYLDRDKEVKEAIRRLPKQLYDERQARQTRALYLDARKQILPRSQWTKPEEVLLILEKIIIIIIFFNSVLRPFQDYFSSYETGQSYETGGTKTGEPR